MGTETENEVKWLKRKLIVIKEVKTTDRLRQQIWS